MFRGTRVPAAALRDNLRDGVTAENFLDRFPCVERCQAESVLNQQSQNLVVPAA